MSGYQGTHSMRRFQQPPVTKAGLMSGRGVLVGSRGVTVPLAVGAGAMSLPVPLIVEYTLIQSSPSAASTVVELSA